MAKKVKHLSPPGNPTKRVKVPRDNSGTTAKNKATIDKHRGFEEATGKKANLANYKDLEKTYVSRPIAGSGTPKSVSVDIGKTPGKDPKSIMNTRAQRRAKKGKK